MVWGWPLPITLPCFAWGCPSYIIMLLHGHLGTRRKAAMGECATVLSRLHKIYAPPRLRVTTIIRLKYLGCILRLRAFSIAVLRTSTRFLCWKSKSWTVAECSHSKRTAAWLRASWTQSRSRAKSSCRFCSTTAQRATRSVVDNMEPGGGSK